MKRIKKYDTFINENNDYTDDEIKTALEEIKNMDHETMCRLWRFAPKGSEIYFRSDLPTAEAFKDRLFNHFGGFTPNISKSIGWSKNVNESAMLPSELKEFEDEFEDNHGYPIGNTFIFAIYEDSNTFNNIDDSNIDIAITPKSYWDNEGCQYDQHIYGILKTLFPVIDGLGDRFDELSEGNFVINGTGDVLTALQVDRKDVIDILCQAGIKFEKDFQDFISQKDTQNVINDINQLGFQNSII